MQTKTDMSQEEAMKDVVEVEDIDWRSVHPYRSLGVPALMTM